MCEKGNEDNVDDSDDKYDDGHSDSSDVVL